MRIEKTPWFKPYKAERRATLERTGAGVYLIRKNGKVVYIGKSHTDVKKTLYRHFQTWTDLRSFYGRKASPYARVTYKDTPGEYSCRVLFCSNPGKVDLLEQVLIKNLRPADNSLKLELFTPRQEAGIMADLNLMEEAPF